MTRKSRPLPFPGSVGVVTNDLCIRRCRAQSNNVSPVNIPPHYIFLILLSVALEIFVLELLFICDLSVLTFGRVQCSGLSR